MLHAGVLIALLAGQMILPRDKPNTETAPDLAPLRLFEKRLEREVATDPDIMGLAVAVVDRGTLVLQRSFGRTARNGPRVDEHTRFRIASLSKGFAATVAVRLAYLNRLDLRAPAVAAAPHFKLKSQADRDRATVEDVLSHRLGLPPHAYDNLLEANVPVQNIFQRLGAVDLVCPVGDCYVYQNVAFSLVEPAVEQAAGRPYEDTVMTEIFQPLAMDRANFGLDGLEADANWARPHRARRGRISEMKPRPAYYRVPSAGGVNASLRDMTLWLMAQMGEVPEQLPPELLAELHRPRVHSLHQDQRVRWMRGRVRRTDYALGWRVYDYAGHRVIYHGGGLAGYRAMIAFSPERKVGLVTLWNANACAGWRLMPIFFDAQFDLPQADWTNRPC
ncbi:MAG: serine hydrolase domain-containing protein [Rhodothalassiaceae bacterium]